MSQAPSMPMYWDAYLADTTHLTTEEHGAYMLLLAAMWRRNGWVPDDDKDNARILGLTVAKWKRIKVRLSGFLILENDSISQKKLLETWKKTQEKIAINAKNGAKGGRATVSKNKDLRQANAANSQERKATIPEPEPEPIKEEAKASPKKTPRKTRIPETAVLSDRQAEIAEEEGHAFQEASAQFERFKDYSIANGKTYVDWDRGWRNWLRSPYFRPVYPTLKAIPGGQHDNRAINQHSKDADFVRTTLAAEAIV